MTSPIGSAATVVLLRDGPTGIEVYLQLRPQRMGFAGGVWVFPGGRIDGADADPAVDARWEGPAPSAWAARLGLPVDEARGHVVAACREMLEEAGLLLARPAVDSDTLASARADLLAGTRPFTDVLAALGVQLDTGRLRYWAWWLTPESEPRRYDTRFFVAGLPQDGLVTAHAGEADHERWIPPSAATDDLPLMPPTRYTLEELAEFDSVEAVLLAAEHRDIRRVLPVLDGAAVIVPGHARVELPPGFARYVGGMDDYTFTLSDANGQPVSSGDFTGQRLIVFFYPKAMTPGCTAEACDFRDRHDQLLDAGYAVVGISPDSPADNARFAAAEGLKFPLLSDPDHEVARRYGAFGTKKNYGREYEGIIRSTFVLGTNGELEHAWRNVKATGHVERVAKELDVVS